MPSLTKQDFLEVFKEASIAGSVTAATITAIGNYELILPATAFAIGGALTASTRILSKRTDPPKSPENPTFLLP